MTRHRSFKRLVRARVEKTGESYTAARAMLLVTQEPETTEAPALVTSDEAIRRRTGRGWEEWFDLLDQRGAAELPHGDVARWVAEQLGIEPLVWEAQTVTATRAKSARFDWGDGRTRVNVGFVAKGDAKSTATLEHARLADAQEAERMKAYWRERLSALKAALETRATRGAASGAAKESNLPAVVARLPRL
jgi:hypothetical protein